jgi:hypothetical protein
MISRICFAVLVLGMCTLSAQSVTYTFSGNLTLLSGLNPLNWSNNVTINATASTSLTPTKQRGNSVIYTLSYRRGNGDRDSRRLLRCYSDVGDQGICHGC